MKMQNVVDPAPAGTNQDLKIWGTIRYQQEKIKLFVIPSTAKTAGHVNMKYSSNFKAFLAKDKRQ